MNKIVIGGLIVLGAGFIATPIIYTKQVDKTINNLSTNLQQNGLQLSTIKNNDSFTNLNREYLITIKDITPIIKNIYPNVKYYELQDLKRLFNNTKFLVKLNFSKYPLYHKDGVKISIKSLSKEVINELSSNKVGKKLLDFIKNDILVSLDISTTQISKAKLKDIDLKLEDAGDTAHIVIKKANIEFNGYTTTSIKQAKFEVKSTYSQLAYNIENLKYRFKETNNLNYTTNFQLSNLTIKNANPYKNNTISLKDISSSSKTNAVLDYISAKQNIHISKISLLNDMDKKYLYLNNITLNTKIDKLNTQGLKGFINSISQPNIDYDLLQKSLTKIINNGISLKTDLLITNININKDKLGKFFIGLDAKIDKNNIPTPNIDLILNHLNANLKIETTKNLIDALQINPSFAIMILPYLKEKNNILYVDVKYNKDKLLINGKPIK